MLRGRRHRRDRGGGEIGLVLPAAVDGRPCRPGAFGDCADAQRFVAPGSEQLPGRGENRVVDALVSRPAHAHRLVVDATNAVGSERMNHVDEIAAAAPTATVVRAFNSVGWEVFEDPGFGGDHADLFWAGPSEAKESVEALVRDLGMRAVRVGGIDDADVVDGVARLWFALVFGQGRGRRLGFRVLQ